MTSHILTRNIPKTRPEEPPSIRGFCIAMRCIKRKKSTILWIGTQDEDIRTNAVIDLWP